MSRIVWLASYPKSGNTWVRILLSNYRSDGDDPVDINDLGAASRLASSRRCFDEWAGVEASSLDPVEVDRLRPEVYRRIAAESREDLFIKAHDAWACDDRGRPMFPADVSAAVVYIVRNPLDVTVSAAHHWHVEMDAAVERLCDPAYRFAGSDSQLPDQLGQFVGSWSDHVRSWLDDRGRQAHVVRYEDLVQDAERELACIVRACGLSVEEGRVRRAVAFSELAQLQRQERAHGFRERPPFARGPFFRSGEVGGWRRQLAPRLVSRVVEAHRATMTRFGYLDGMD